MKIACGRFRAISAAWTLLAVSCAAPGLDTWPDGGEKQAPSKGDWLNQLLRERDLPGLPKELLRVELDQIVFRVTTESGDLELSVSDDGRYVVRDPATGQDEIVVVDSSSSTVKFLPGVSADYRQRVKQAVEHTHDELLPMIRAAESIIAEDYPDQDLRTSLANLHGWRSCDEIKRQLIVDTALTYTGLKLAFRALRRLGDKLQSIVEREAREVLQRSDEVPRFQREIFKIELETWRDKVREIAANHQPQTYLNDATVRRSTTAVVGLGALFSDALTVCGDYLGLL